MEKPVNRASNGNALPPRGLRDPASHLEQDRFFFSQIQIHTADIIDWLWIRALQRTESNRLGFLNDSALRQYCEQGSIRIAWHGTEPVGYILSPHSRRCDPHRTLRRIWQIIVTPNHRRLGIAHEMLAQLRTASITAGYLGLDARCAAPLEANLFWQAEQFHAVDTLVPGNRRKREITVWRLPLGPIPIWFHQPSKFHE